MLSVQTFIRGAGFVWWDFFNLFGIVGILALKVLQIKKASFRKLLFNYKHEENRDLKKQLLVVWVFSHFEFVMIYYCHF